MLGSIIRGARKRRGLTQTQLAERCGVTQESVSQWEDPENNCKESTLAKVATALGLTVDELLVEGALARQVEKGQRQ